MSYFDDCISVEEAAFRAGVTKVTIMSWCKKYGFGKKLGGRWKISAKLFEEFVTESMVNYEKNKK